MKSKLAEAALAKHRARKLRSLAKSEASASLKTAILSAADTLTRQASETRVALKASNGDDGV